MQRISDGDQRPVDAILASGSVLQPGLAVIQLSHFRKRSTDTGHIVRVIATAFSFVILNRCMREFGDITGMILLGVVIVVVIGPIEK